MQKTGAKYKNDENYQASPIQVSTSVLNAMVRHEFYSVERAENSLHLLANNHRCGLLLWRESRALKPGFSVY